MFNFFGDKKPTVEVEDKIWISKEAKWMACAKMAQVNSQCIFVAWFEDTRKELSDFFKEYGIDSRLVHISEIKAASGTGLYIFVEHYPLLKVEQDFFLKHQLKNVPVLSSLDEPLFQHFGGDRLISMVKKLGMEADEIIGHPMINKSINRAQAKIQGQVVSEQPANSQKEWFEKNLK